ncbi:MAG: hypothetical protein O7G30_08525 [Proteobacteria bacterium]|nr:hypothetical protein [Pseudomonadota bacterium]
MDRLSRIAVAGLALLPLVVAGCMSGAWKQALRDDTPAAYYRFLRDHPDSKYAQNAKTRLEYHKIKRRPTLQAFAKFSEQFPDSELLAELRPLLEEKAFEAARGVGTADAYNDFLVQFPDRGLADRAAGNAVYLEHRGYPGDIAGLDAFARAHPASDFASEARRTVESLGVRDGSRFSRVGLRIQISPGTSDPGRLLQAFTQKAVDHYTAAGVILVPIPEILTSENGADLPTSRLTIEHREIPVNTQISGVSVSRPGVMAETRVSLRMGADGPLIWEREFTMHVSPTDHVENRSVLFGPTARRYWSTFFVPVATWQTRDAVRAVVQLAKTVTAVDAVGDRALVLFEDGDFQLLELSDPSQPVVLAEHQRAKDFKRWSGIRALGGQIAIFGEDGLELVRFTPEGTETVLSLERGEIGSVLAAEPMGDGYLLASNRGLILTQKEGTAPVRMLRRRITGLAVVGDTLIFSDGESVLLSSLSLLRENRVLAQLRLGRDFGPGRIRAFGSTAVVIGQTGVLVVDMANPRKPRVLTQLHARNIGPIQDAIHVGGRIFLLGDRGLQVLDPSGRKVINSIDVATRTRIAPMGRHLVAIGQQDLQVVDSTPFTAASFPARSEPAAPAPAETAAAEMESVE